jgi:tetratricopeptide (TPR) repeat protein
MGWVTIRSTTAERELRSAVALNPNYASAHSWLGRVMQSQGRTDEALAELRLATEIDPLSPIELTNYCGRLVEAGRETEAIAALDAPEQYVNSLGYVLYDRRCDPIRSDPRFTEYLAELGLTEAHARAQAWRAAHPPEKPAGKP